MGGVFFAIGLDTVLQVVDTCVDLVTLFFDLRDIGEHIGYEVFAAGGECRRWLGTGVLSMNFRVVRTNSAAGAGMAISDSARETGTSRRSRSMNPSMIVSTPVSSSRVVPG